MARKRSHGEGTVWKLKNGKWHGQLMDGYNENGKRKIVSFTAATKKALLAEMREYQEQKDANVCIDKSITLTEWSNTWYENYRDQVQPSTYSNYKYTLKIIQEHLGDRKLNDILPLDIERFIRTLRAAYSDSCVNKCRAMLIQIYDAADANALVMRNPARKAKNPRNVPLTANIPGTDAEDGPKKDAFTPEEIALLLKHLEPDLLGHSIRLMLGTGVRVQELLALTKADIPMDGSFVTVNKAVKTVNGRSTLGPPKSTRSNRVIPVPQSYRESAIYIRTHGNEPFLWTASWKNPLYSVKTFRAKYYRAIKRIAGVRPLSPHCCRHTYITQLEAKGVPMERIARLTGHSKVETTNRYLHTSAETLAETVAVLNQELDREVI